jgi:hypothetical protein
MWLLDLAIFDTGAPCKVLIFYFGKCLKMSDEMVLMDERLSSWYAGDIVAAHQANYQRTQKPRSAPETQSFDLEPHLRAWYAGDLHAAITAHAQHEALSATSAILDSELVSEFVD